MANMLDDDPMVSRIKKLMNVAGGEGPEAERNSAMAFAKKLMAQYNISEHQLLTRSEDARKVAYDSVKEEIIYSRAGSIDIQDTMLAGVVEILCDVRIFTRKHWGPSAKGTTTRLQSLVFIGLVRDVEIARAVYLEQLTTMRTMCRFRFPKTWRSMQHSYLPAFVHTLVERARKAVNPDVNGDEVGAIVLCKKAIIDQWIGDKMQITEGKARVVKRSRNLHAAMLGSEDAVNVELPDPGIRPTKKLGAQ